MYFKTFIFSILFITCSSSVLFGQYIVSGSHGGDGSSASKIIVHQGNDPGSTTCDGNCATNITIEFTSPNPALSPPYDWFIKNSGTGTFPDFLTHTSITGCISTSAGNNDPIGNSNTLTLNATPTTGTDILIGNYQFVIFAKKGAVTFPDQIVEVSVLGGCGTNSCCTIDPNSLPITNITSGAFPPVVFSESSGDASVSSWKWSIRDPNNSNNLFATTDAVLGLGFTSGILSTFNTESTTTGSTVNFGGQTPGAALVGQSVEFIICVEEDGTPATRNCSAPTTYSFDLPTNGNTLAIVAKPNLSANDINEMQLYTDLTEAADWMREISYSRVDLSPVIYTPVGWEAGDPKMVDLDQVLGTYVNTSNSPLGVLVDEVLSEICQGETNDDYLDGVEHIMIFVTEPLPASIFEGLNHYSTIGKFPYTFCCNGTNTTKELYVSVFDEDYANTEISNGWKNLAHALGRNKGLKDLYPYTNVAFYEFEEDPANMPVNLNPDLPPNGFDHMAKTSGSSPHFNGAHPLIWNKEFGEEIEGSSIHNHWVTNNSSPSRIVYIPRVDGTINYPSSAGVHIGLLAQSALEQLHSSGVDDDEFDAIMIGLTRNATQANETRAVFIEARNKSLPGYDDNADATGVFIYYAERNLPNGFIPVRKLDRDASQAGFQPLGIQQPPYNSPAPINLFETPDSHLKIWIDPADGNTPNSFCKIRMEYKPPIIDYDLRIDKDPTYGYLSPDIWVENQLRSGSQGDLTAQPVDGEENRIFARVHNDGPADAFNVLVKFKLVVPGGLNGFEDFKTVLIDKIDEGGSKDVFVIWTPEENLGANESNHACVSVTIEGDNTLENNTTNNVAQQNMNVIHRNAASPYPPLDFAFNISNPDSKAAEVFFRAHQIPDGWDYHFTPNKMNLNADQSASAVLHVQPPEDYDRCTNHPISITGWVARENTLLRMGEVGVFLSLRNKTDLTLDTEIGDCDTEYVDSVNVANRKRKLPPGQNLNLSQNVAYKSIVYDNDNYWIYLKFLFEEILNGNYNPDFKRGCNQVVTRGCTNPPRPFEKIAVRYRDPAGNPVYKEVQTDANGCYEDLFTIVEGGNWEITAIYPGDDCSGPAEITQIVNIGIPANRDQDGDGLSDDDEIQGDDNGNGRPNHLDRDSDSDGIIDGDELPGNCDQDSYPNVIDRDSDNDGVIDGRDKAPCDKNITDSYGPTPAGHGLHLAFGITIPVNDFDDFFDPGFLVELKYTKKLVGNLDLNLEGGYYTFDETVSKDVYKIIGGAAGLKYNFLDRNKSKFNIYLDGNLGFYKPDNIDGKLGLNAGLGLTYDFGPFFIEAGGSYFHIFTKDPTTNFIGLGGAIGFKL